MRISLKESILFEENNVLVVFFICINQKYQYNKEEIESDRIT
jgi:hypothetical protein